MNTNLPPTVVDVADLFRRPGVSRPLELDVPPDATLDLPLTEVTGPVEVRVLLESLVDGILARGTVSAPATLSCARCLEPIGTRLSTEVVELFADPERTREDDEVEAGYEIREATSHPHIDLDVLVRDALVDSTPLRPLCASDCRGLCASCGTNLNTGTCRCEDEDIDERWAALRDLDLGQPGT